MKPITPARLPMMREHGLIVDDLTDEVLVYDLDRHKAHCLSRTAALVWRNCDGKTAPQEIARRVEFEINEPFNEELVWLALAQLDKINLLEPLNFLPTPLAGMSRREMVRTLGIAAAVAVPLVTSIIAPTAVQASTCVPMGGSCSTGSQCCSKACDMGICK
jgi:hypothetical protein